MSGRKDFLSQPAPENYVAGLGRGATGFTTRSDLGPAREGPSEEQIKDALAKRAAALGNAPPTAYGVSDKKKEEDDDDERFQDPENETGLFASGNYDRDDDEADRIYQDVDERMDKRRKSRREAREKAERDEYERNNPKIQQQFADLKRALGGVTDEEWASIPEIGDLTGKNRRNKQNQRERFYAVPDSVLAGARDAGQMDTTVQEDGQANGAGGASLDGADGVMTNFADIGAARDKVLQVRLDQAAQGTETVSGTSTTIDPKGYLTSLSKSELKAGEIPVADVNRARTLLDSVIKTNMKHGPGWIAAARLEEYAGKIVAARNKIAKGCEFCPKNEDVWLEAIRLNNTGDLHNAKVIAANAIKNNNRSVRLWIEAMKLEHLPAAKKRVLRQALDNVPQSVAIWKEAVNLEEDPADARLLLWKATEIIPLSVELWLALARLETPENAQKILNKALAAIPTSHEIWIAGGRLQEQMGNEGRVAKLMNNAMKSLAKKSAMLSREEWIEQAEKCEEEGAPITGKAIIDSAIGWGLDEDDDRKKIWLDDAKACTARGNYQTARAIYAHALEVFSSSSTVWVAAADMERTHGTKESLIELLEKSVAACPKNHELWMQLAREQWQQGNLHDARVVLGRAFDSNPNNEDIWLAAVKLEADDEKYDQARDLLSTARTEAGTDRTWIKSVAFERQYGDRDTALDLVNQGLQLFPKAAKLWMMKGQLYESKGMIPQAREAYGTGTRACPKSVPLWLLASRLEEKAGVIVKARSILDRARLAVPHNGQLWTETVRLERRAGNMQAANQKMAQALQEVTDSGLLWSEKIWHLEPRTQRKPRSLEAIRKVDNDPILFVTVARIFWGERKLDKAASWFQKAVVLDPDDGDTWAWWYKFLLQHGTEEKQQEIVSKCVLNDPKHGEMWQAVAKAPENAKMSIEEVLKLVASRLQ
ncbi:pre-mRNA-splicing factor prp1 [Myriangium duriaei CBS 260.36]|uniref:Pre-mRNA-splicing factor prp1 n=1 Tax=Myriangium duriaei CBS 260.36 TaxID=1168546 RepID=A0A9P4MFJ4_9PEZI|nr:pre-mRNA-splicing factor prp1 [Myriangium duriaei CBS 260.36]